jgi:hypothetical protein
MPNSTLQGTSVLSEATACSVWGNLLGETLSQFGTVTIRGHFDFIQASPSSKFFLCLQNLSGRPNITAIKNP